uniref:Uncharacterized protein n=1 Tax=Rhizophora mucronata TaxID=61149 RepID=A0A2P2Q538_RHIMU
MGKKLLTHSRAPSSNEAEKTSLMNTSRSRVCENSSKGKEVSEASGIEQLHERLRILEEELDIMKQEFYEHIEERRKLVHEIQQQFQTIQNCLQFRNQMEMEGTPDACFLGHNDKVHSMLRCITAVGKLSCPNIVHAD